MVEKRTGATLGVVAPPVEHDRPILVDQAGELGDEQRLADALRPHHRDEAVPLGHGVRPSRPKPRQLGLAAEERGTHGGERARETEVWRTGGRMWRVQGWVL